MLPPILDRARRIGATTRPRRVGHRERRPDQPARPLLRHLARGQARAINEAEWIAWRTPRIRSATQYLWRDDFAARGFQSGVRFANGDAKPSYAAYRFPLVVTLDGRVWARLPPGVPTAELRGPRGLRRILTGPIATIRVPARRGIYRAVAPGARSRPVRLRG